MRKIFWALLIFSATVSAEWQIELNYDESVRNAVWQIMDGGISISERNLNRQQFENEITIQFRLSMLLIAGMGFSGLFPEVGRELHAVLVSIELGRRDTRQIERLFQSVERHSRNTTRAEYVIMSEMISVARTEALGKINSHWDSYRKFNEAAAQEQATQRRLRQEAQELAAQAERQRIQDSIAVEQRRIQDSIRAEQQRIEAEQRAAEERRIADEQERARQISAWANRMTGNGDLIFRSANGGFRFRIGHPFPPVGESYVVQDKRVSFRIFDKKVTVSIADPNGVARDVVSFELRRRGRLNRIQIYGNMTDQSFGYLGFGIFDIR